MAKFTELQKYKYATIGLAILAVILLAILYSKGNVSVRDIYRGINTRLDDCRVALQDWKEGHPAGQTLTSQERSELDRILENCTEELEASGKAI